MKKILSLILAFSFFASEASFMDKVKALPGKAKAFAVSAKEFGINTIDAAKANKPKAMFTTLQLAVAAQQVYQLGMPEMNTNLFVEDKHHLLSTGDNSLLGKSIITLYSKIKDPASIKNKGFRPLTYVQNFFDYGTGGTLFILEILKRLTANAE